MAELIISERTSPKENYAIVENGEVKVVLNESTKRKGYMPMSEAKEFMHSLIKAHYQRDQELQSFFKASVNGEWRPKPIMGRLSFSRTPICPDRATEPRGRR